MTGRGLSQRRACALVKVGRSALRYRSLKGAKDAPVLARMVELAARYPRYGYRRVRIFLGRDGHKMSFGGAYRGKRRINRGRSSQVKAWPEEAGQVTKTLGQVTPAVHRPHRPSAPPSVIGHSGWVISTIRGLFTDRRFRALAASGNNSDNGLAYSRLYGSCTSSNTPTIKRRPSLPQSD